MTDFTTQCITPDLSGDWQVVGVLDNCPSELSEAYDYTGRPIVDPSEPQGIKVFPNPANDGSITIQTIKIPEDDVIIDIYDVLGRLMYRNELNTQQAPESGITIDIGRLPPAVYVVVVDAGFSGRFVKKFLVEE